MARNVAAWMCEPCGKHWPRSKGYRCPSCAGTHDITPIRLIKPEPGEILTPDEVHYGENCSHCEELRVVGPDHRNTLGCEHDEGCELG